jgi:transposase-like protein
VAKGQRRFEGFDHAIISLYSRGLTTREIEGHLLEIYGVAVSPALVSQVTDAVCADVQVWQNRPLEEVYPIVYFDALWGKVRDNGQVAKLAVYLALGIGPTDTGCSIGRSGVSAGSRLDVFCRGVVEAFANEAGQLGRQVGLG